MAEKKKSYVADIEVVLDAAETICKHIDKAASRIEKLKKVDPVVKRNILELKKRLYTKYQVHSVVSVIRETLEAIRD